MKRLFILVVCAVGVLFCVNTARALDFDFSGSMPYHNSVLTFNFTANGSSTVTLFSSSWDDGGFDPMLGLWDSSGNLLHFQDDGGNIGSTMSNGVWYTHGNWDSYYSYDLSAGDYIVTLTAYNNFNNDSYLSHGFYYDGQTPIPIVSWNEPANGYRQDFYVFHLLNVDQATPPPPFPEPATMLLVGSGLLSIAAFRRKVK